ncbi:MAG: hypothetical protein MRY72_13080 [Aquisalinus sp.]|nr:hypothetical protein [Aquisalinus sp.]
MSADDNKKSPDNGCLTPHTPAVPEGRGPGRPLGSKNKKARLDQRIEQVYGMRAGDLLAATVMQGLPEWLQAGGDAGDFLAQSRAVEVAEDLDIEVSQAFAMLKGTLESVLPYTQGKMPPVQDADSGAITFQTVMGDGTVSRDRNSVAGRDLRPADVRAKDAEKQAGSDASGRKLEDKSHETRG